MTAGNGSHGSTKVRRSAATADAVRSDSPGGRDYALLVVGDRRLAVPIDNVERVVHAVQLIAADLPAPLAGWVNLHGEMIPAVDLRSRLGLESRDLQLSDRFVLVRRGTLRWFLIADGVAGIVQIDDSVQRGAGAGRDATDCCSAEVAIEDDTVAFLDVARLLGAAEVAQVQRAQAEVAQSAAMSQGDSAGPPPGPFPGEEGDTRDETTVGVRR